MPKPSKRDQLVEATKELLWEVGYEAMSPRDIQSRSAAKPGSLRSRKFAHKLQALWDACVAEGLQSQTRFVSTRP
jgi:TetR/AcrR family transcriptional repressor of nem operon